MSEHLYLLALGVGAAAALGLRLRARRTTELRQRAFAALAGPPPSARSTVLRIGSSGPDVLRWKQRLREVGYTVSQNDVFDDQTEHATAQYQQSLGLAADGLVGPNTVWRALFRDRFRRRRRP